MQEQDDILWARARRVRDQVLAQVIHDPNFEMIDVGIDPLNQDKAPVVRVYLKTGRPARARIPTQIRNVPIRILSSNIKLQ